MWKDFRLAAVAADAPAFFASLEATREMNAKSKVKFPTRTS